MTADDGTYFFKFICENERHTSAVQLPKKCCDECEEITINPKVSSLPVQLPIELDTADQSLRICRGFASRLVLKE